MKTFQIISSAGVDMGQYKGANAAEALDAMARDAGYRDQADAAETAGAFEGSVTEMADEVEIRTLNPDHVAGATFGWHPTSEDDRVVVLSEGSLPVRVSVTLAEGESMDNGWLEELLERECASALTYGQHLELGVWDAGEADGEQVATLRIVGGEPEVRVSVSNIHPSTCCDTAGALDATVTLTVDGKTTTGEVTMLRHECSGRYASWGPSADYWCSAPLMAAAMAADALDAIEAEAGAACDRYARL